MHPPPERPDDPPTLADLVQEFEELLLDERAPSIEAYLARHPARADEARPILDDLVAVRAPWLAALRTSARSDADAKARVEATAARPPDRDATAHELAQDLGRGHRREKADAPPLPLRRRALRTARRHPLASGAVALLLLLVLAWAASAWTSRLGHVEAQWTEAVERIRSGQIEAGLASLRTTAGFARSRPFVSGLTGGRARLRVVTEPRVFFRARIREVDPFADPHAGEGPAPPGPAVVRSGAALDVRLPPGCWELRLEAEGYHAIDGCNLFLLPRNDLPGTDGMHDRDLVLHLVRDDEFRLRSAEGMVYVPPGDFLLGSNAEDPNERPRRIVYLSGFFIQTRPVTFRDFYEFVAAGGYERTEYWKRDPAFFERHIRRSTPRFVSDLVFESPEELRTLDLTVPADDWESLLRELGREIRDVPRYYRLDRGDESDVPSPLAFEACNRPGPAYFREGRPPVGLEAIPILGVSLDEAAAYATWRGGLDLPTMEQWEKAAAGPWGWPFPWDPWDAERNRDPSPHVVCDSTGWLEIWRAHVDRITREASGLECRGFLPAPVDLAGIVDNVRLPASYYGCLGMQGNTFEWTRTRRLDPASDAAVDAPDPWFAAYVVKGGDFELPLDRARSQALASRIAGFRRDTVSFRCVRNLGPARGSESCTLPAPHRSN